MVNAKDFFREGWVMLLRPFEFAGLPNPLQKLSILYAFSEKPIISREYDEVGKVEWEDYLENFGRDAGFTTMSKYARLFGESELEYDARVAMQLKYLDDNHRKIEIYEGNVVQCTIGGNLCRFYPDEYNIIKPETFNQVIEGDEYFMVVEHKNAFEIQAIKDKVHYIRQRGIPEELAKKWSSHSLKDAVYFKPRYELLEIFCRDHEIFLPDSHYPEQTEEFELNKLKEQLHKKRDELSKQN